MSIESKIRFKAAGLYIIVGVAAAVMLIYLLFALFVPYEEAGSGQ